MDMEKKEGEASLLWFETSDSVCSRHKFEPDGRLSVVIVDDSRPFYQRVVGSFMNKFFPSGYPYSVNEGYLRYTQFRALQHVTSAALSVLSTQSLLFAAGLRPTPAQATAVSWILKDGMQHVGKLICSNWGARMDSEPKRWRLLADVLYDIGIGLEVLSPLCPHLFLEMAGLGNFAKGMAVVAARATRLPIYSSFAKEGNLSDLFAKGEAFSTLFNVIGIGVGIQLASTICASIQGKLVTILLAISTPLAGIKCMSIYIEMGKRGHNSHLGEIFQKNSRFELHDYIPASTKLVAGPLLSIIHLYSVSEEMRATPINTLNPRRTAMVVDDFLKAGVVSSPSDLRYRENLLFNLQLKEDTGNVRVGKAVHKAIKPSRLLELKQVFHDEKFLLNLGNKCIDMVLEQDASGEDALRGWLVAAYAAQLVSSSRHELSASVMHEAYEKMNGVFPIFLKELQNKGWYTDRFLDGTGSRFAF